MKTSCFERLAETVQTDIIWERGIFLARRKEGFHTILLFQLDDFYTELYYHSHFNVIIKIVSFADTELLEPYLKDIQLSDFFGD